MSGVRSAGFSKTPLKVLISGCVSFHSMQAVWQALQPMHLDASMSLATSVWRSAGGVIVEADRRMRSFSDIVVLMSLVGGLGTGGNICRLPHATGPVVGSMLTRNALYSGVSMLASPTTGVSMFGPKPFFAAPVKPQCSGIPTMWTVLPSQVSGLIRLVTIAFATTEPRFD